MTTFTKRFVHTARNTELKQCHVKSHFCNVQILISVFRCALHYMALYGRLDLMRLALNIPNVQLELRDQEGKTPFFLVCVVMCI